MLTVWALRPLGIGRCTDAESRQNTIGSYQAAEVRCLGAGPVDIVAVCMAQPEDLHDDSSPRRLCNLLAACGGTTQPVRVVMLRCLRRCVKNPCRFCPPLPRGQMLRSLATGATM